MKGQPMKREKIFANDVTYKGLISEICKQLIQQQRNKQPNQNMDRRNKQTFLQRRQHADGQEAHEKMLNII